MPDAGQDNHQSGEGQGNADEIDHKLNGRLISILARDDPDQYQTYSG